MKPFVFVKVICHERRSFPINIFHRTSYLKHQGLVGKEGWRQRRMVKEWNYLPMSWQDWKSILTFVICWGGNWTLRVRYEDHSTTSPGHILWDYTSWLEELQLNGHKIYWMGWFEESGQRLENVDWTHLGLASGNLALQKTKQNQLLQINLVFDVMTSSDGTSDESQFDEKEILHRDDESCTFLGSTVWLRMKKR